MFKNSPLENDVIARLEDDPACPHRSARRVDRVGDVLRDGRQPFGLLRGAEDQLSRPLLRSHLESLLRERIVVRPRRRTLSLCCRTLSVVRTGREHQGMEAILKARDAAGPGGTLTCVVEIPKGSRNKYEYDAELGATQLAAEIGHFFPVYKDLDDNGRSTVCGCATVGPRGSRSRSRAVATGNKRRRADHILTGAWRDW
jgi:hypothetical protein